MVEDKLTTANQLRGLKFVPKEYLLTLKEREYLYLQLYDVSPPAFRIYIKENTVTGASAHDYNGPGKLVVEVINNGVVDQEWKEKQDEAGALGKKLNCPRATALHERIK